MERCSPVEMRKNMVTAERFSKIGLDFVAVPARNSDHKAQLMAESCDIMEEIASGIERELDQD